MIFFSKSDRLPGQTHLNSGHGADLSGSNLSSADISGANLRSADISGSNLSSADLSGSNLSDAKYLTPEQVKSAKNWDKAKYDKDFRAKLGLPPESAK